MGKGAEEHSGQGRKSTQKNAGEHNGQGLEQSRFENGMKRERIKKGASEHTDQGIKQGKSGNEMNEESNNKRASEHSDQCTEQESCKDRTNQAPRQRRSEINGRKKEKEFEEHARLIDRIEVIQAEVKRRMLNGTLQDLGTEITPKLIEVFEQNHENCTFLRKRREDPELMEDAELEEPKQIRTKKYEAESPRAGELARIQGKAKGK